MAKTLEAFGKNLWQHILPIYDVRRLYTTLKTEDHTAVKYTLGLHLVTTRKAAQNNLFNYFKQDDND